MIGSVSVQQPVTWIFTIVVSQQERDDLASLFYRMKDGEVVTGLSGDQLARVNNLALPLYQLFEEGATQ